MEQKIKSKKSGKKDFYAIEAPITSIKISLYGSSAEEFEGRVVKLDLTKSLRGKSLELKMKIKNEKGKLVAMPIGINLIGSYIRRSMRRGIDYVEDSFDSECKDANIKVKPFLITRKKVSRKVRKILREEAKKYIEYYTKTREIKELFSDIMTNKLQKGMAAKLKKIYPLAMCEIRVFEFISDKKIEEKNDKNSEEKELGDRKSPEKSM